MRVNDVAGSAREGLHAMASDGKGLVFAAWLDLREKGTRIYGAASTDGGVTWSGNQLVYASPSGTVCQCCHPSVAVDARGAIYVMFRNAVEGSRDLYLARSDDGGKIFGPATKLGRDTWKLNACPMDGGGLAVDRSGQVTTIWRRGSVVFATSGAGSERALWSGKNPTVAATRKGTYFAWSDDGAVLLKKPGVEAAESIDAAGAYPSIVALGDEAVLVAWESKGAIMLRTFLSHDALPAAVPVGVVVIAPPPFDTAVVRCFHG